MVVVEVPIEFTFNYTIGEAEALNRYIKKERTITCKNGIRVQHNYYMWNEELGVEIAGKNVDINDVTKFVGKSTENSTFWKYYSYDDRKKVPDNDYRQRVIDALDEVIKLAKANSITEAMQNIESVVRGNHSKYFTINPIYDEDKQCAVFQIAIHNPELMKQIKDYSATTVSYEFKSANGTTNVISAENRDTINKYKKDLEDEIVEQWHKAIDSLTLQ